MANKTKSESAKKSSNSTVKAAAVQETNQAAKPAKVQFINPFKGVAKEERRSKLHDLTSKLRFQAQAEGVTDTVNQLLLKYYKEQCGAPVLRTFEEWKERGRSIGKGEKAIAILRSSRSKVLTI